MSSHMTSILMINDHELWVFDANSNEYIIIISKFKGLDFLFIICKFGWEKLV